MYFRDGPLPTLSRHEEDALDLVIETLESAAEEYIVEDLHHAIRQVWEVALRIGVKHGQQEARQAHTNTTAELGRKRVWGFDVGWALAREMEQSRRSSEASKASIPEPSLPSLSSVSTVATQTDPVTLHSPASDSTPTLSSPPPSHPVTDPPPSADNDGSDLDVEVWHVAPERLPADSSPPSPSPATFPRDFSDLRTGTSRPFASLQRRRKRVPRTPGSRSSPPRRSRAPQTIVLNIYDSRPKKLRARYADPPDPPLSIPASYSYPPAPPNDKDPRLDWVHDPRLRDLSRALTALGWVRPG
ncbi:hypothetical protein C8R44DRAFT_793038 [Mycena epipterygia]|nr:hypothetical protein C8R44DRAFT_793038 [Mycena epipterygia]